MTHIKGTNFVKDICRASVAWFAEKANDLRISNLKEFSPPRLGTNKDYDIFFDDVCQSGNCGHAVGWSIVNDGKSGVKGRTAEVWGGKRAQGLWVV